MTKYFKYFIAVTGILLTLQSHAQQERKFIRQGNRNYNKAVVDSTTTDTSMYQKAEVDYRKAINKQPNSWDASYNLANALYRQAKYEDAIKQYQAVSALDNSNVDKTAQAYHNLGNSLLQAGKVEDAIEAYKDALRKNPNDFDTKYNLAWAQNKLKQQQNQNQNQDKNQDKDKDKDKEQKDKDQKQDQQNQDQKDQQNQQKQDQQQQQQQQDQQQQQQKNQMSKEDAMRILEALQNDEKQVQDKVQKDKAKATKRNIEKDW